MTNLVPIKEQMLAEPSRKLVEASRKLVPWWSVDASNALKTQTEADPKSDLDSYYLFPLDEISVNADCNDVPAFINERFQNILAAASHSGLSVALVLSSKNGNNRIFLGFKNELATTKSEPSLFESIVNGIFPGKNISYDENANISSLADGFSYGGMVTGVPIVKIEDEKQKFNLSSVTRSLYGKEYLFMIISRPVSESNKQSAFHELIPLRDALHALVKQTVGENKSLSESETLAESSSKTRGHSAGGTAGLGVPTPFGFIGIGGNYSHNWSSTEGNSTSSGKTDTFGSSLSFEQQNGFALELEKIADQYIERMMRGFGVGYWETSITFATQDKITSDILAGTFIGELAKPSNKMLPPPRIYQDNLGDKTLFVPKKDFASNLFPKKLASYITSEELAFISSPPVESIPGYEIHRMPTLALSDIGSQSGIVLGSIADHGNPIRGMHLHLSKSDLNKHLFICGLTGSGKTTTVKHILKSLTHQDGIPFLVLESAKRDYRQLLADEVFKGNLNIFTIGDGMVSPIRFNPFYIQKGVHPLVHIDYLKAIFNASFSLYGPMPSIVEKCLHAIYIKKGWDLTSGTHPNFIDSKGNSDERRYELEEHFYCFPTLIDLKDEVDHYIKNELDYQGELRDNIRTAIIVRLESLCVGAKGLMFNTHDFFPIEKLLSENTILEMESLADDDDKAFFVGLVLVLLSEYRQKENPAVNPGMSNQGLRHFMVIEEAHRLLKNVDTEQFSEMMGNPKGKAVEVFSNILAEMRSLGQGVAVVEQIPSKISPDVIKNSNTKIVHRLVSKDDQSLLAGSLSINEHEALYLNRLKTGHALCHKEGMARPVECVIQPNVSSHAISDEKIKRLMEPWTSKVLHGYQAYQIGELLGQEGKELAIRLFNSLVVLEKNELNKLIERATEEMRRLLILKKMRHQADMSLFLDYFSLQIMLLLNKGVYCCITPLPENFKSTLVQAMQQPNELARKNLIHLLDKLWMQPSAKEFIEDVIETLLSHQICKKEKFIIEPLEVKKQISSFFLFGDCNTLNLMSKKIQNNIEAANA